MSRNNEAFTEESHVVRLFPRGKNHEITLITRKDIVDQVLNGKLLHHEQGGIHQHGQLKVTDIFWANLYNDIVLRVTFTPQ